MKRPNQSAHEPHALHRIREVRLAEDVSLDAISRRMKQTASQLKKEECGDTDLRLSDLYRWQTALKVPLIDLLEEPDYGLSESVRTRASLTRIAKTAHSILKQNASLPVRRLAQTLLDQLVDMMPELQDVGGWHDRGVRKSANELGRIVDLVIDREWWAMEEDCPT